MTLIIMLKFSDSAAETRALETDWFKLECSAVPA